MNQGALLPWSLYKALSTSTMLSGATVILNYHIKYHALQKTLPEVEIMFDITINYYVSRKCLK